MSAPSIPGLRQDPNHMATVINSIQASRKGNRLEFLDAARGLAAVAVVVQHSLESCVPGFLLWSVHHLNFGAFGVVMFFIVSGFIIPASIERSSKLTSFWYSRFFRLYPMYWTSLLIVLILGYCKLVSLPGAFAVHPIAAPIANVTMLQTYLRVPDALGVYWTLSLELFFYVLCSLLFITRWHNRSLLWGWVASATMASSVLFAGLAYHRSLPAGRIGLLVTAFVGTAIFRSCSRQASQKGLLGLLLGALLTFLLGFWFRFSRFPVTTDHWNMTGVSLSWALAYAVFALLLSQRERQFPKWILWMGRISYSLYLVHGIVLALLPKLSNPIYAVPTVLGLSIAISAVTYQYIEKPGIAFFRSHLLSKRLRLGSNTAVQQ
jgi:peptidoglycan/LPS O-acetylase OafA/YrhL